MKLFSQKNIWVGLATLFLLHGCGGQEDTFKEFIKKENVYIGKPKVETVPSGVNKVKFFVTLNSDPKISGGKVLDLENKVVHKFAVDKKTLKDNTLNFEVTFKEEQEGSQTFLVKLEDKDNNESLIEEVQVNILGKRYEANLLTRKATVAAGGKGLIFDWGNDLANSYESTIAYTNVAGKAMTKAVAHKTTVDGEEKETKQTIVSDVKPGSTLKVYTSYKPSSEEGVGVFQSKGREYKMEMPVIESISPEKGLAGAEITIKGKNFHPTAKENKVLLGTVELPVSKASATSLTVKAPKDAKPGAYSLMMKVAEMSIAGKTFTVMPPPPPPSSTTLTIPLSHQNDDVEESMRNSSDPKYVKDYPAGKMHLTSSDLELGKHEVYRGIGPVLVGTRFRGVKIPKGAKIIKASIVFMADAKGEKPCKIRIHGEAAGNAAEYKDESRNLSKRMQTTASVLWDVKAWPKAGDKGEAQTTADLKAIVQEIIAHKDWKPDNAMNFIFTPETITVTDATGGREAETFDGKASDKAQSPVLTIVYE